MVGKKNLTLPIKKFIVAEMEKNRSSYEVAKQFNTSFSNVCKIYKRWKEEKTLSRRSGSGRPRKSTEKQNRILTRMVESDPKKTAVDIQGAP